VACDARPPEPASREAEPEPLVVYAVNAPLALFAERIGGSGVSVHFPAPAGVDPAFWEPDGDTIAAYQRADVILLNGASYAKWTEIAALPESRTIDTSRSFESELIRVDDAIVHRHGAEGEHHHAGAASTTWIDFRQALAQAEEVHAAIVSHRPHGRDDIDINMESLRAELDELDRRMVEIAARIGDRPLVASHPVYQYWARRYGLNVEAVTWEPEVVPDDAELARLAELLRHHPARTMIWEKAPDPRSVAALEAMGIASVVFDPCGNRPASGDFLSVMRENLDRLDRAFPV
jgi:zinc transport system substrate-binding protein